MDHLAEQHVHLPDPPATQLSNPEKDKWPTPHSARLTALVEGKQHSCRMIAAVLNQEFTTSYTRSAIIGRIHRMGLQIESQPRQPRAPRVRGAKPLRKPMLRIVAANGNSGFLRLATSITGEVGLLRLAAVTPLNLTLAELPNNGCRYIAGEPVGGCFCGHPQQGGSSYCPGHHRLSWRAPEPRNRIERGFK